MQNIIIDDGKRRFTINGDETRVIEFDAGDINILVRAEEAEKQIQGLINSIPDTTEENCVEVLKQVNEKIKEAINHIFDSDVYNAVFGNASPLALKSGKTLVERFFEGIMPVIKKEIEEEQAKAQKRMEKHLAKYKPKV